ncbi:hypothetical protein CK203_087838 [Vitis vinifera]|uniref:Retrotransposon gag domain-containing protein n=1 Tax=Vitis vinifera TaxID=29760 RepID=A0A438E405_VITVI|nr:hypothetical protein CK203_087838 [Vitis vinifera]
MGAMPWPDGASDKQPTSIRVPMHSTGAQCPVHQEGTAMGTMPWFVEAEPDIGRESNRPRPWVPRHGLGSLISVGRHTDTSLDSYRPPSGWWQLYQQFRAVLSSCTTTREETAGLRTNTSWEDIPVTSCVLVSLWFAVACVCECCEDWEGRASTRDGWWQCNGGLAGEDDSIRGGAGENGHVMMALWLRGQKTPWEKSNYRGICWSPMTISLRRKWLSSKPRYSPGLMIQGDPADLWRRHRVLKKAVLQGSASGLKPLPKFESLSPKGFNGNRNAKELENFLWDIEQFFKAAHVPDGEKVSITSMYLTGDAKLWWRTRMEDDCRVGKAPNHHLGDSEEGIEGSVPPHQHGMGGQGGTKKTQAHRICEGI